jgi:hypothetical protein
VAVSEQTPVNSSTGNGVTTVFPYTFKILNAADIEVTVDGVVKTLTTHYTLSGVGDDAGGDVTFLVAPANGTAVIRRRDMALVRTTDYQAQGELPADVLNDDQDAPVLMLQQVQEQVDRSIKIPLGETGSMTLPTAEERAGGSLAFDGDGNPIAGPALGNIATAVTAAAASAAAAAVSAAAAATAETNAETAETNAEAAEVSAEAAQLAAEIARDTALTLGKLFADTTAGLAAVAANEYFLVPVSSTDYTELVLYQDVAGVATERGRWSISYFETSILGQHVYADKNGNVFAYYDQNGELRLNGHERGVNQRLDDARAQAFVAAAVPIGLSCEASTSASDGAALAAEYIDNALGGAAWASEQFLALKGYGHFDSTEEGPPYYPAYRNPTIMQIEPGHCLLFFVETMIPAGNDDQRGSRITVMDVYFDFQTKALTCSDPRIVIDDRAFTENGEYAIALGHAPILVRTGPNKGRIWLPFTSNKDDPDSILFAEKPYLTYSDDLGQTWAARSDFPEATGSYDNVHGFGTGMKSIQLKYGTYAGRLVIPWYGPAGGASTYKFFSVYSDDGGDTWTKGPESGPAGVSEPSYVEHTDGTVFAFLRDESSGAPFFTHLWKSVDGGVNFTQVTEDFLSNNSVQCSAVQASESTASTPKMLVVWPNEPSERSHLTVRLSYDGWVTWTDKELTALSSGYSGIDSMGEDYFLVAWESKYFLNFAADSIFLQVFNTKYITD